MKRLVMGLATAALTACGGGSHPPTAQEEFDAINAQVASGQMTKQQGRDAKMKALVTIYGYNVVTINIEEVKCLEPLDGAQGFSYDGLLDDLTMQSSVRLSMDVQKLNSLFQIYTNTINAFNVTQTGMLRQLNSLVDPP